MPKLAPIGCGSGNSLQKTKVGGAGFVNKGGVRVRERVKERRGEERCYPVNENIGGFIRELDSLCVPFKISRSRASPV